jgi:uncharacterized protein (DUF58 family)
VAARSSQPRVWVLPNSRTPGLVAVLIAMWYAGASQGNGTAYLLCFVLAALALVSTVHAWGNLRGLAVRVESVPPVFAGEELIFPLVVETRRERKNFALEIVARRGRSRASISELESDSPQRVEVSRTATNRGCFEEVAVSLRSSFPLGFFTAVQRVIVRHTYYVYPAPRGAAPLPRSLAPTRQPRGGTRVEGDDYGGLRAWQPGESQRHIDWKAAARGQPLLTKQWTGEADEILYLDWQDLAPLGTEDRLSQLAKWIVLAERSTAAYELRLPGKTFPASRGDTHYHACLWALASFTDRAEEESA